MGVCVCSVESIVWRVGSGEWGVGSGEWGVGSGEWGVGSGEWRVGSGEWGVGSVCVYVCGLQCVLGRPVSPGSLAELCCCFSSQTAKHEHNQVSSPNEIVHGVTK